MITETARRYGKTETARKLLRGWLHFYIKANGLPRENIRYGHGSTVIEWCKDSGEVRTLTKD